MKAYRPFLLTLSALALLGASVTAQAADLKDKIDSPGFRCLEKARKAFIKKMGSSSFQFPRGKKVTRKDIEKLFKEMGERRTKARKFYRGELETLRGKFLTDKAINKIRLELVDVLFDMGEMKAGRNELSLLDPIGLNLKEKMTAIQIMIYFNMNKKASTMMIGMDPNKLTNERQRYLVITLLAATGQKDRAIKALKEDLADMEDDEEMWDEVDDLSKMILSFNPGLARPLLAALYEETLRRYPDTEQKTERTRALKGLQMAAGKPAVPLAGKDLGGKQVSLAGLKGKVVLIHFWGSWNKKTMDETKDLKKLVKEHGKKGFTVLGVALDRPASEAKDKAKELELPWPTLCDGKMWKSAYIKAYAIKRLPFSILVDKQGNVQAMCLTGKKLEGKVKELL